MELISVIVPIYNVQPYLERCINSLIEQSYTNTELILVDDGSVDGCPAICDRFAAKDSRIKVVHKPNGGLSDARNAGIEIASGELIAFVDSDDWVESDYLSLMYRTMKDTGADIVECASRRTDGKDGEAPKTEHPEVTLYRTEAALEQLITDGVFHQTVWNKLYRRELIGELYFPVGKYNEDEFWTYKVFGNSKLTAKLDAVLYNYYQNAASIMGQGYKLKRLDAVEAKLERQQYIAASFPALKELAGTNLVGTIIYSGQMSMLHLKAEEKEKALSILHSAMRECSQQKLHYTGPSKHRIWYTMAGVSLELTCSLRNRLGMNI